MDIRLLKTKYPIEFPRRQRSLNDFKRFKANEFRNMAFYNLIGITRELLPTEYYNHLVCYLVFLRLLNKDQIVEKDIKDSEHLINLFCKVFEELYGIESSTFNLHAHLHLPNQVRLFGPLNKISCMAFEGMFKYCKDFLYGTRGLPYQIAKGIQIDRYLYFNALELISTSGNQIIKSYVESNLFEKCAKNNLAEYTCRIKDLNNNEQELFLNLGFSKDLVVEVLKKIVFNNSSLLAYIFNLF